MKAMLIALIISAALIGLFGYIVHRDPHSKEIQSAIANLKTEPGTPPNDPDALGFLNLKKRHPDGYEGPEEFDRVYSTDLAMERMTQVEGFLKSFRTLTRLASARMDRASVSSAGNTESDMQSIGFHNIPLVIEGTILKQEYQLRQAEYRLAQLRSLGGDITSQELEQKRAAYATATKKFQVFWDTKLPTD